MARDGALELAVFAGSCVVTLLYIGTGAGGFVAVVIGIFTARGTKSVVSVKSWISAMDQPVARQQSRHAKPGLYHCDVQPLLAFVTRNL
jgi:hypothetical protein